MKNKDIEDIIIEYCEGFEHLEFNYSDLPKMAEKIKEELATENHRLRIALHEAINRPKGIVPHEAKEFYGQDFYSNKTKSTKTNFCNIRYGIIIQKLPCICYTTTAQ